MLQKRRILQQTLHRLLCSHGTICQRQRLFHASALSISLHSSIHPPNSPFANKTPESPNLHPLQSHSPFLSFLPFFLLLTVVLHFRFRHLHRCLRHIIQSRINGLSSPSLHTFLPFPSFPLDSLTSTCFCSRSTSLTTDSGRILGGLVPSVTSAPSLSFTPLSLSYACQSHQAGSATRWTRSCPVHVCTSWHSAPLGRTRRCE